MTAINLVRTWSDDVALGVTRATEARTALAGLVDSPSALDETVDIVRSGAGSDDPFDVVLELAEGGNRGLWDGWTKAEAAQSLLTRAVAAHPGGAGVTQLHRAQDVAEQAAGDIGNWIATGGRGGTLEALEASVRSQLDEVRQLGEAVLAAG
jgi:hypothetical protein